MLRYTYDAGMKEASVALDVKAERAREQRQHLGHLDALRGLAILGVLMIHSGQWFPSRLSNIIGDLGTLCRRSFPPPTSTKAFPLFDI